MDDLAQMFALPIATGFLPQRYRDHFAGGRLIVLSKHPKPGVRPICISDAIRRLVAKGLVACCKASFPRVFQNSHPRALQFGANLKNGETHMFHLMAGVLHSASECTDSDDCFPRREKRLQYFVPSSSFETFTVKSTISC